MHMTSPCIKLLASVTALALLAGCQAFSASEVNPPSVEMSASLEKIEALKTLPPGQRKAALKKIRNDANADVENYLNQAVNWRHVSADSKGFKGQRRLEDNENNKYWEPQRYGWEQFETMFYEPPGGFAGRTIGTASDFHLVYQEGAGPKVLENRQTVGFRAKYRDKDTCYSLMKAIQLAVVAQKAGAQDQ